MNHAIKKKLWGVLFLSFCGSALPQWQWNSDHIDQGLALTRAYELLDAAYENFSQLETPEYIDKPPHSLVAIETALDDMNRMLNDDIIAEGEDFYPSAIQRIIDKFNERSARVEYSVGEILIKRIQAGDQQAVSLAEQILSWGFLQVPPLFDPGLNKQYRSLIHQLEQALD